MDGAQDEADRRMAEGLARRYGISAEAVLALLRALRAGGGTQAQFSHPELGGMGQWSNGMLMIGEMFNDALKSRVGGLAGDLAALLRDGALKLSEAASGGGFGGGGASGGWWPAELGRPSSTGSQNGAAYALFPERQRLAVRRDGVVTLHDMGGRLLYGVSQQQGGGSGTLSFSGPDGTVRLEELPVVGMPEPGDTSQQGSGPAAEPGRAAAAPPPDPVGAPGGSDAAAPLRGDMAAPLRGDAAGTLDTLERLAALRDRGVLTEDEFAAKKAELLRRL
ncbi:SHOCT domain-containing protein [Roseomonas sp. OT10]|uniref:SHOCT domain-containing protein n=1 Tax=Roseomonas cutis TaxID=2897332 RepID=UPI001E340AAA|nr:SHOCT domain-containing protein [Roseomonas sp. OT10]UFN48952.1 SHOCT domain-containing protein [Roseomonas sp. OT10]